MSYASNISKEQFICSCTTFCGGKPIPVSRATFYRHRNKEREVVQHGWACAASHPPPDTVLRDTEYSVSPTSRAEEGWQETAVVEPTISNQRNTTPIEEILVDRLSDETGDGPGDETGLAFNPASFEFPLSSDNLEGDGTELDVPQEETEAVIHELRILQQFNKYIRGATIAESAMPPDMQFSLRNPPTGKLDYDSENGDLELSIELFHSLRTASREVYENTRSILNQHLQGRHILSHYQVKQQLKNLSGISPILHDMCVNSCLAFAGPFSVHNVCPFCSESRYDSNRKPRQRFYTIPVGPQLQALWRSPLGAKAARYRAQRTREIRNELTISGGRVLQYEDIFYSEEYMDAVGSGQLQDDDMLLMLSLDGAQLYQHKQSDVWIYIWVIFDLPPDMRYKSKHVLIGGIIPGPNNPKHLESFLAPGLHHLSALQSEGLTIWDGERSRYFTCRPMLGLGTADAPGIVHINGLVGHIGAYSCRLYCSIKGRRKRTGRRYFPALQLPDDYNVADCNHPDVPIWDGYYIPSIKEYKKNLDYMLSSSSRDYDKRRRDTGISRPSILEGLSRRFSIPGMFAGDAMHAYSINIPEALMGLWRGSFPCDKGDNLNEWDWAIFRTESKWEMFGNAVQAASRCIPSSFGRSARNPFEKISSGYKAVEYQQLLWGLSPGLLYNLLPKPYFEHHCKLVAVMRVALLRSVSKEQLLVAHKLVLAYLTDLENLYIQRKATRIHFIRPCFHTLLHIVPETIRLGPGSYYAQWTLERTIGNLGEEVRQPSNPFANLSERGVLRAQLNSLQLLLPGFNAQERSKNKLPRASIDVGNGYVLLPARDHRSPYLVDANAATVIRAFLQAKHGDVVASAWVGNCHRWARLHLPNGQVARSYWGESRSTRKLRESRNVKITQDGTGFKEYYAEVQYFFQLTVEVGHSSIKENLALISLYSGPNLDIMAESHGALALCCHSGHTNLTISELQHLRSVVAIIPMPVYTGHLGYVFAMERFGIDIMQISGEIDEEDIDDE